MPICDVFRDVAAIDMIDELEFTSQVGDAYEHLYDLVYLGGHPLMKILGPVSTVGRRENAWKLHQILLDVITELDPGPQAPTFSREWRRHRLMELRYVDGLSPDAVAEQLAVSRRQYYRMHEAALTSLSEVLWNRYKGLFQAASPTPPAADTPEPVDRLELMRLEAAQMTQANRYAHLGDVIQGVLVILKDKLNERTLEIDLSLPEYLPEVALDRSLLRQMFLGVMGYLIDCSTGTTIRLCAQNQDVSTGISMRFVLPDAISPFSAPEAQERLAALEELAALNDVPLCPVNRAAVVVGFDLQLPTRAQRTVLVVDDNADVLELFQRYLILHRYQPVTTCSAQEALALARRLQPLAITLDLMMPDQDGWDLLQTFLNQVETRHIPIIVCSVLRQKELALSLGAATFLEKPISEQMLISALEKLEQQH